MIFFCGRTTDGTGIRSVLRGPRGPKKCTEYHLVSLLNAKHGSTFANFLDLFYPLTLLTNSALIDFTFKAEWRLPYEVVHVSGTRILHLDLVDEQIKVFVFFVR